jgi:hypothetical protein
MIEDNLHWPLPLNHSEIGKAYEDLLASRFINITPLSLIPGAIIMYLTNLQVIDFEDGGDSALPWKIAAPPVAVSRSRAPSSSSTTSPLRRVLPTTSTPAIEISPPPSTLNIFLSPSTITELSPPILGASSFLVHIPSPEPSPSPRMRLYQFHQFTFILAAGRAIRDQWIKRGKDKAEFDDLWRAMER